MIVLNGKYGYAPVFLPNDHEKILIPAVDDADTDSYVTIFKYLDDATKQQIESFLNHPAFRGRRIRIMPDTHFGKGSCVGFTMDFSDYIIPNIVGVDIGCGILTCNLGKLNFTKGVLTLLDEYIRENIPSGFNIHQNQTDEFLTEQARYDLSHWCMELGIKYDRVINSVGTLGGGNHFIELGMDESENIWLTIHSGSRNFGLQVAKHFQSLADDNCAKYFQDFGDLNFLTSNPNGDSDLEEYLYAMEVAQKYADLNRRTMMSNIVRGFCGLLMPIDEISSVHNYIDLEAKIIRKGATDAQEGTRLVIPFNMEEGLILATGLGNPDWNYSAPHGAGRILSRNAAKKSLSLEEAKLGMDSAGVYTTSLDAETLDEAKGAYKSKELIMDMIRDTVRIDSFVRPLYNFKAGSKNE